MLKKVFLVVTIIMLAALGVDYFQEYMLNHSYYESMRSTVLHRKIIGAGVVFALLPTAYLLGVKKGGFLGFIGTFLLGLFLFVLSYLSMKNGLEGGVMKLLFNVIVLFGLGVGMVVSFLALGGLIKERLLKLTTTTVFGVIMNLGLGLCAFLLINHILILANLFYGIVTRAMFAGAVYMIRATKATLANYRDIILQSCNALKRSRVMMIGVGILLVIAFIYFFNGFTLAFIPYSTAWDANHAYMFFPKMRVLHHGYYRNEPNMMISPQLWYSFIAYRFGLFIPLNGFFGLSADTYAIQMNFWSGVFVLIFGWAVVSEVLAYVRAYNLKNHETAHTHSFFSEAPFLIGGLLWLLRLTSGMGAFLVFIDNKTDLGVLALILLAIYSGFYFLRLLQEGSETDKHQRMYVILSGFFYAIAVLAKPTAFFDVANFGLFLRGVWFGLLGVAGIFLLIVGGLGAMDFRGVNEYMTTTVGTMIASTGIGATLIDFFKVIRKKSLMMMRYMLLWIFSFVAVLFVIKLPVEIGREILLNDSFDVKRVVQNILFAAETKQNNNEVNIENSKESGKGLAVHDTLPLYAQATTGMPMGNVCTLSSQGFSSSEELYDDIQELRGDGYTEDVGRYVGFGWKGGTTDQRRGISAFINPRWGFVFSEGCHNFSLFDRGNDTAKILCETQPQWTSKDITQLRDVQQRISESDEVYTFLGQLIDLTAGNSSGAVAAQQADILTKMDGIMQNNSVRVEMDGDQKIVYFPYKYLNIFNITFNRSLQNLSSYYTDIGVIRLLLIISSVIGLMYGLIQRQRVLATMSMVTLCGWLIRWFIGGGILWYAIGIIAWTILSFVVYLSYILGDEDDITKALSITLLIIFVGLGGYQMSLNMVRIASQGGGGAFLRYKSNAGVREEYDTQLRRVAKRVTNFGSEDIFNLQFPQYNKIIKLANARGEDEGMLVAGTYLRYFVDNQRYVKDDGFLGRLWQMFSDSNTCNAYLRLKDGHIRYIVIDPNIGTVVQGGGNQTLFDRFFARLNPTDGTLLEHGAISMLVKLQQEGYVRFVSSNNLGAKYAFTLPDQAFGDGTSDEITLAKSRMAIARFWGANNAFIQSATAFAKERVANGEFVDDLADLLGKEIRSAELIALAKKATISPTDIAALTQDERAVLSQFLSLIQLSKQNPEQFSQQITNIINSSIGAGSQLIVLEVL